MDRTIASKKFYFGKIAYYGKRTVNRVYVTAELRQCGGEPTFDSKTKKPTGKTTPEYIELSICGEIWNSSLTDIVCGGQCLDTISEYREQLKDVDCFDELYQLWKRYHLNGMKAGTPSQEAAVNNWKAKGNTYDYDKVCEMLKKCELYTVPYCGKTTGKQYRGELYTYGHGWCVEEIPGDVLLRIEHLLNV